VAQDQASNEASHAAADDVHADDTPDGDQVQAETTRQDEAQDQASTADSIGAADAAAPAAVAPDVAKAPTENADSLKEAEIHDEEAVTMDEVQDLSDILPSSPPTERPPESIPAQPEHTDDSIPAPIAPDSPAPHRTALRWYSQDQFSVTHESTRSNNMTYIKLAKSGDTISLRVAWHIAERKWILVYTGPVPTRPAQIENPDGIELTTTELLGKLERRSSPSTTYIPWYTRFTPNVRLTPTFYAITPDHRKCSGAPSIAVMIDTGVIYGMISGESIPLDIVVPLGTAHRPLEKILGYAGSPQDSGEGPYTNASAAEEDAADQPLDGITRTSSATVLGDEEEEVPEKPKDLPSQDTPPTNQGKVPEDELSAAAAPPDVAQEQSSNEAPVEAADEVIVDEAPDVAKAPTENAANAETLGAADEVIVDATIEGAQEPPANAETLGAADDLPKADVDVSLGVDAAAPGAETPDPEASIANTDAELHTEVLPDGAQAQNAGEKEEKIAERLPIHGDRQDTPTAVASLRAKLAKLSPRLAAAVRGGAGDAADLIREVEELRVEMDGLTQRLAEAEPGVLPGGAGDAADLIREVEALRDDMAGLTQRLAQAEPGGAGDAANLIREVEAVKAGVERLYKQAGIHALERFQTELIELTQRLEAMAERYDRDNTDYELQGIKGGVNNFSQYLKRAAQNGMLVRVENVANIVTKLTQYRAKADAIEKRFMAAPISAEEEEIAERLSIHGDSQDTSTTVESLREKLTEISPRLAAAVRGEQQGGAEEENALYRGVEELMTEMAELTQLFEEAKNSGQQGGAEQVPDLGGAVEGLRDWVADIYKRVQTYKAARLWAEVGRICKRFEALAKKYAKDTTLYRLIAKGTALLTAIEKADVAKKVADVAEKVADLGRAVARYKAEEDIYAQRRKAEALSGQKAEAEGDALARAVEEVRAKLSEISQILETAGSRGQHVREEEEAAQESSLARLKADVDGLTQRLDKRDKAMSRDLSEEEEEEEESPLASLRAEMAGITQCFEKAVESDLAGRAEEEAAQESPLESLRDRVNELTQRLEEAENNGLQVGEAEAAALIRAMQEIRIGVDGLYKQAGTHAVERFIVEVMNIYQGLQVLQADAQDAAVDGLIGDVVDFYRNLKTEEQRVQDGGDMDVARLARDLERYRAEVKRFMEVAREVQAEMERVRPEVDRLTQRLAALAEKYLEDRDVQTLRDKAVEFSRYLDALERKERKENEVGYLTRVLKRYQAEAAEYARYYGEADEIAGDQAPTVESLRAKLAKLSPRLAAAVGGRAGDAAALVREVDALRVEMADLTQRLAQAELGEAEEAVALVRDVAALRAEIAGLDQRLEEEDNLDMQRGEYEDNAIIRAVEYLRAGVDGLYNQAQTNAIAGFRYELADLFTYILEWAPRESEDEEVDDLKYDMDIFSHNLTSEAINVQLRRAVQLDPIISKLKKYKAEAARLARKYQASAIGAGEEAAQSQSSTAQDITTEGLRSRLNDLNEPDSGDDYDPDDFAARNGLKPDQSQQRPPGKDEDASLEEYEDAPDEVELLMIQNET
jgi:DNA repair exonuclease SbcCD ATPase subunit